jgi:hypothetical protein
MLPEKTTMSKQYWPSDKNRYLVVFQPHGPLSRRDEQQWAFFHLEAAQAKAREVHGSLWRAFGKGWLSLPTDKPN